MFRFLQKPEAKEVKVASTVEIARQTGYRQPAELQDSHKERVYKLTGRQLGNLVNSRILIRPKIKESLREMGFQWFVSEQIVNRFLYAATVRVSQGSPINVKSYYKNRGDTIYTGDIPEFVLDNIEKAIAVGIYNFTIHSNQPIPVEFVYCDPILIGWEYWEIISNSWNNPIFHMRPTEGVVIAIWDMKGEEIKL